MGSVVKMRAARYHGNQDVRVERIPRPTCGPGQVAIKPAFVGICGSDVHEFSHGPMISSHQAHPLTDDAIPVTLGHEISGTVDEVGADVADFRTGDTVFVMANLFYETCEACRDGRILDDTDGFAGQNGGLSDCMVVDAKHVLALPKEIPLDVGALVEPIAVSWHGVRVSKFAEGDAALIVGAGPIGVAVLLALKAHKASKIIVVEMVKQRKRIATELGATHVLDPRDGDTLDTVKQLTGGQGVNFAYECAGAQATLDLAISATCPGGTTTIVSMFVQPPTLNIRILMQGERKVTASVLYTKSDFEGVMNAIVSGRMDPRPLISSVVKLEDVVEKGIQELIRNKDEHVKILVDIDA